MENRTKIEIPTVTIIKVVLVILLLWFLYAVRDVVVLFFIVLVIVAALGPLVDRMSRHIPRVLAMIILSLTFLTILAAIGYLIIPPVVSQLQQLAVNLPYIMDKLGPLYQTLKDSVSHYQEQLLNLSSQVITVTSGIFSTTLGFVEGLIAVITIVILSFYMLLEAKTIKGFLYSLMPAERKEQIVDVLKKIANKMGSWMRGQVTLMLVIGILDGIALMILGVPYALTLAVWGALTEVIPYVGPWLGLLPAFLIALTISPLKALFVLIAYILIQQLESQFLAPKIMGKAVGLSPVIIILALLCGAKLMGILGVIIAVPIAAALAVLIQEWPDLKKIREN